MDTAVDSIVVANRFGVIQYFNRAAERLFGYAENEAIGHTIALLMRPTDRAHHKEYLERYLTTGEKRIIGIGRRVEGERKDGTSVPIYLAISEFETPDGLCFAGVMRDMSADLETRELRERLAHTERLSAMAETTAAIAHEVNQPLTAIAIYAETARDIVRRSGGLQLDKLTDMLDKVVEQSLRAGAVMERVQRLVRGEDGNYETADINALMLDVVELARLHARSHNIAVELQPDRTLPPVHCDPVQIQQVVLNLIRNAVDAMVEFGSGQGNEIAVSTHTEDHGRIRIDVTDFGPGIEADIAESLFTPFHTSKARGFGVGLAICQTIVLNHNGHLRHHNNIDGNGQVGGATFSVTLPIDRRSKFDDQD